MSNRQRNLLLISALDRLDQRSQVARFRFNDGEVYDLRIVSTMHVEEGGDALGEVVRVGSSPNPGKIPEGGFINFFLSDVTEVTLHGECIFPAMERP